MKHKAIKIIIVVFLANLALAGFALPAQAAAGSCSFIGPLPAGTPDPNSSETNCKAVGGTWTPGTNDEIWPALNTAGWNKAQTDKKYCLGEFKDNIFNITGGLDKATWLDSAASKDTFNNTQHCFIVKADAPDFPFELFIPPEWRQDALKSMEVTIALSTNGILKSQSIQDAERAQNEQVAAGAISALVGWVLNALLSALAALLGIITAIAGGIFSSAVNQILNVNTMPGVVNIGWAIIRDICNMFFILALIVIALANILRLEEYEYKHLLGELILMALLVNFSKVIALTIMNLVNFVAAVFYANGLGTDILKSLLSIAYPKNDLTAILQGGWQTGLMLGLGKVIFMVVAAVVYIALAAMFVIRLVGLYILIIFSPIAFAARVLPATHHFSEEWWSKFIKYLIWAPVALFMIRLTVVAVRETSKGTWLVGGNDSAFYYFILCAFLAGALLVAEEAGMVGSKAIMGAAEKAGHWAGHAMLEKGDQWLAKGHDVTASADSSRLKKGYAAFRRGASYLSVGAAVKGYKARSAVKEHEAYATSAAARQDLIGKVMSLGKEKTDYERQARRQFWSHEEKEIQDVRGRDELMGRFKHYADEGEKGKAAASLMRLMKTSDFNEILVGTKRTGEAGERGEHYETTQEGFRQFIQEQLVDKGVMNQDEAFQLGHDLSRQAEDIGHWNFARAYKSNDHGKFVVNEESVHEVIVEQGKVNEQDFLRKTNRLGWGFKETGIEVQVTDPTTGEVRVEIQTRNNGVGETGRAKMRRMTDYDEWERKGNQSAKANWMFSASKDMLNDNKKAWMRTAKQYAGLTPEQREQLRASVSQISDTRRADNQQFSAESVEAYRDQGLLTAAEAQEILVLLNNVPTPAPAAPARRQAGFAPPAPAAPATAPAPAAPAGPAPGTYDDGN